MGTILRRWLAPAMEAFCQWRCTRALKTFDRWFARAERWKNRGEG